MAVVAAAFGWSYETFQKMPWHELVMLWYPRALADHRTRNDSLTASVLAGIARGFGRGRK